MREFLKDFDEFTDDLMDLKTGRLSNVYEAYDSFDGDILGYMQPFFKTYVTEVEKLTSLDFANKQMSRIVRDFREKNGIEEDIPKFDVLSDLKTVCNLILDCLSLYMKGFPADAYNEMEKVMTDRKCHLMELLPQVLSDNGFSDMYRVRRGERSEAKDLFHVPFDKREQCDSYRFSILGVPALYCGASLETALLESQIDKSETYTAALFRFKDTEKVAMVDLTMLGSRDYSFWERYSLILFFPLIVACGLRVRKPGKPFRPEYIISQLFYQLIRQHGTGFDGIIYTSTKYPLRDLGSRRQSNYVLFVPMCDQERGYNRTLADRLTIRGPRTFGDAIDPEAAAKILRGLPSSGLDVD